MRGTTTGTIPYVSSSNINNVNVHVFSSYKPGAEISIYKSISRQKAFKYRESIHISNGR